MNPGTAMRRQLRALRDWAWLLVGAIWFKLSGRTPRRAYYAMVSRFCSTGGRSNDLISRFIALTRPKPSFTGTGILGLNPSQVAEHVALLQRQGYFAVPGIVPPEVCERLRTLALSVPCRVCPMDGQDPSLEVTAVYGPDRPPAARYELPVTALLADADVQSLLADPSLLAIATGYLGTEPRADVLSMWWHAATDVPDSMAAQFYHFDMDRPKWLKVFVYLSDVGPANGPHTFVAGSQRTGAIPDSLLAKGYSRLSDEEVTHAFGADSIVEFSAPRGTLIVEDTRGLHKGRHVEHGDRLILQLQFSNSLFGATYPSHRLPDPTSPALREMLGRRPRIYEAFR